MSTTRAQVARLIADGQAPVEIARLLGLARNTVYYHLRRLREAAAAGEASAPQAALPRRARWSVETGAAVHRLLDQGLTRAETAERLGVSRPTVSYHARRLGLQIDARCARRYDWDEVQAYHDAGHSARECAAAFGFSLQSWHAARLRGDLRTRSPAMPLDELLVRDRYRSRQNIKRRLLAAGIKQPRCERCLAETWEGRSIPLDLHHANGVRDDNRLENLFLLCPNCHAIADGEGDATC